MSRRTDIFLSYPGGSPEDGENVRILGGRLELFGLQTWIAERDSIPGVDYKAEIAGALESANCFAACLGSRPRGRWGRSELDRAAARAHVDSDYVLLSVLLPGYDGHLEELPSAFRDRPVFDLRNGVTSVAPLVPLLWARCVPERARLLDEVLATCRAGARAVVLQGPIGSGKSMFARVVASALADDYPDGYSNIRFGQQRSMESLASLVLRYLRLGADAADPIGEYRRLLAGGRYLIAFDDYDEAGFDSASFLGLIPPAPSTLMIVGRRDPGLGEDYPVFSIEPTSRDLLGTRPVEEKSHHIQPGYISDAPGGEDLLNVQRSVDALCSIVAAKDVGPPLSIGLFGNWGTGKTFFIERMRIQIDALANASATAADSAFCSSVRQITFNAWHYSDTNLWASLASHVFEGLAIAGDSGQALIEELASSQAQLKDADTERLLADRRAKQAQREQQQARDERVTTEISLSDLKVAGLEALDDAAFIEPLLSQLNAELHTEGSERITVTTIDDLRSTRGLLGQIWLRSKLQLIGLAAFLTATVALAVAVPHWYAFALPAVAAALSLARLLSGPVQLVARASRLARERASAQERKRDVELQSRLEQLRADERAAVARVDDAQRQVEAAERAIDEIKSGRRLFNFIHDRAAGGAYEPYLGIIAVVRKDFQRLAELMNDQAKTPQGDLPRLERIVLYIDDLDRCPSDRVVQVLEAVHLLLASSLFVVVLAVDPRWLLRSLARHHQTQLNEIDSIGWAPTPQDYLEKIFQIPFSLPLLADVGFERLIESFIPVQDPVSGSQREEDVARAVDELTTYEPDNAPLERGGIVDAQQVHQQPPMNLDPVGLRILPAERAFMFRLSGMIGTPRSAKRLTNLYRLVRASLAPERLELLLGESVPLPEFPCVQILLAVVVGSPSLASSLLGAIATTSGRGTTWWEFVDAWSPDADRVTVWLRTRQGMERFRSEPLPGIESFAGWVPDAMRYSYDAIVPIETGEFA